VVGVNDGRAFTVNPCLSAEAAWAGPGLEFYLNLNQPFWIDPSEGASGPAGTCQSTDAACQAYNYGYNAAEFSLAALRALGLSASMYWLDVELPPGNAAYPDYWNSNLALNAAVVQGAIAAIEESGASVGIYSTYTQWTEIVGSYSPGVPNWVAGAGPLSQAAQWCMTGASTPGGPVAFGGGVVELVQYGYWGTSPHTWDEDYAC